MPTSPRGLLRRHGLECFTVGTTDRTLVVKRMHETRYWALFQSSEARSWTLDASLVEASEEPLDIHLARIVGSAAKTLDPERV